jgi:hypothetical protein
MLPVIVEWQRWKLLGQDSVVAAVAMSTGEAGTLSAVIGATGTRQRPVLDTSQSL